jgi:hypothetical protein
MKTTAVDQASLHEFLGSQGLDADQVHMLKLATDPDNSAQASFVALQTGIETGSPTRTYFDPGAVTIIDTPEGRVVAEQVSSGAKSWMIIAPGTKNNIGTAINQMVRRLPADQEWYSHRKVV